MGIQYRPTTPLPSSLSFPRTPNMVQTSHFRYRIWDPEAQRPTLLEVRCVNGIWGHNCGNQPMSVCLLKALTFGLTLGTVTYFAVLGSYSHSECQSSSGVTIWLILQYFRTGNFLKLYISLSHAEHMYRKQKKKSVHFFQKRKILHKTETWP